jgi:enamine deaminase RidA (YjgF/YER057c/UK114 family)
MADVARYRVYLVDIDDWTAVARALKEAFGAVRPCSTLLAVAALIDPAMRVEIEVDAVVSPA